MRVAGVGAKAHDGRKAKALAAVLAVQTEHLIGNFALRHAFMDELDGVGHHGVVGGRGHAHELLLGGILVGACGGDGKIAQEKLAGGVALHELHQKAGTHDGVDAERFGRIDLASDGVGHDIGIGVIGDAGIVVLGQLMQCVDQDHRLGIAHEQHAAKTLEHIGIKAGQVIDRPWVVYEQLCAGVLSLERIEHACHTLVIDMCHETSFHYGATMVSQARHIGTFLLCRHLGTLLGMASLASVQAKAAKRAPSQISYSMSMLAMRSMLVLRRFFRTMSPMRMGASTTTPRMRSIAWA